MNATRPKRFLSKLTYDAEKTAWDAIVIGAGLGGMTAAAKLAKEGKKVLLLEKHVIPGGYATCFKRKGFTFEVSLHQTPGFAKKHLFHQVLTELGVLQKLTPIPLNETFIIKTERHTFHMGATYLDELKEAFPESKEALIKLEKIVENVLHQSNRLFPYMFLPDVFYNLCARIIAPDLFKYKNKTLEDLLNEFCPEHNLLKQLISILWGYLGLPLNKISAILYLLEWGGFMKEGIYYLKGTSQALSNAFIERFEDMGGQLVLMEKVEKILLEKNTVVGVRSRTVKHNGQGEAHEFKAPVVISNANPILTYYHLVGKERIPQHLIHQIDQMEVSASATVLYIGLDCKLSDLTQHDYHSINIDVMKPDSDMNKWFEDVKNGTHKGTGCLTDYSAVDPDLAPPGKSSLMAINIDFLSNWEHLSDQEYKQKKIEKTQEIIEHINSAIPGFKDHVELTELGTPRTMERYTSNYLGAFNGFAYTTERVGIGKGGLDAKSPINGLYLCGAWIGGISGGYSGSVPNGYFTAQLALRKGPWKKS